MSWNELEKLLSDAGTGVRNFDQFATECMVQARNDSGNALPYVLLGIVAERLADADRHEPLGIAESEMRSNTLKTWVQKFREISESHSNEKYLITNSFISQELDDW